jgi:WD40 repeat protein
VPPARGTVGTELPVASAAREPAGWPSGHTSSVRSVAFSPDGQHVVSGGGDKLVKVWSVSAGLKEVALLGPAAGTHELCLYGRLQSRWATYSRFLEVTTTW